MKDIFFSIAQKWHSMGFNILPIGNDKRPLSPSWTEWQTKRQTSQDLEQIFNQSNVQGLGCVMGGGDSTIRCIDIDKCTDISIVHRILQKMGLPETYSWVAISGSENGYHIYFCCDGSNNPISNEDKAVITGHPQQDFLFNHIELRWKNCFTVLPPSSHPSGKRYRFINTNDALPYEAIATLSPTQVRDGFFAVAQLKKGQKAANTKSILESACSIIRGTQEGQRNNVLFRQSCRVAEVIPQGLCYEIKAQKQLFDAAIAAGLEEKEALRTIQSAFKRVQEQTLEPSAKACANDENASDTKPSKFWIVKIDDKSGRMYANLDYEAIFNVLDAQGYCKYYFQSDEDNSVFVQYQGKIVQNCSAERIRDFLNDYVAVYPFESDDERKSVITELRRERHLFTPNSLLNVKPYQFDFLEDTSDTAYFVFQNCWLSVTQSGIQAHELSDLPKYVWHDKVKNADFILIPDVEELQKSVFMRFLRCICTNRETGDFKEERLYALLTSIGYLLHEYKKPSEAKAVLLYDEPLNGELARADLRSGRTGKSLLANAIKQMRNTHVITKPKIDVNSRFVFQNVTDKTRIILLDDIAHNFDFSALFALITEGIEIERKYQQAKLLDYKDCPKIFITSNFPVKGSGDSFQARRLEIELCRYFNAAYTPRHEFQHEFFEEWDAEEWNRFYNTMLYCVQLYFERGLQSYISPRFHRQRVIQETSEELVEFLEEYLPDVITSGDWVNKRTMFDTFIKVSQDDKELQQKDFTRYVKKFCVGFGLKCEEKDERKGGKKEKLSRFTVADANKLWYQQASEAAHTTSESIDVYDDEARGKHPSGLFPDEQIVEKWSDSDKGFAYKLYNGFDIQLPSSGKVPEALLE